MTEPEDLIEQAVTELFSTLPTRHLINASQAAATYVRLLKKRGYAPDVVVEAIDTILLTSDQVLPVPRQIVEAIEVILARRQRAADAKQVEGWRREFGR